MIFASLMATLRFGSDEARSDCCDLGRMRRRWGGDAARRVSRRLQQLEAVTTLADIAFLPFDSFEHGNGEIEIGVTDDLGLFITPADTSQEDGLMFTIIVTGLRVRSAARRP